ncbi:LysE family translocator [Porticoccaceae bacterium LTM1]|nr:LysE family translocator [Porticoccaceae bacterium LTM1]
MDLSNLPIFILSSLVLIMAPGPDVVFLVAQSVRHGRLAGLATALGLALGNLVHTLAAALGVSIIFQTSALAFMALKIIGALYLLFLAYKIFRPASQTDSEEIQTTQISSRGLLVRGLLMNIFNPKVALFFLAFLPQFVISQDGPVWIQMGLLGVVFTLLVVLVFGGIGMLAGTFSQALKTKRFAKAGQWANRAVGLVFVGLAVRLLMVEQ